MTDRPTDRRRRERERREKERERRSVGRSVSEQWGKAGDEDEQGNKGSGEILASGGRREGY